MLTDVGMKPKCFLPLAVICLHANCAFAQFNLDGRKNVISTAVAFLTISPDSRSGAMGEVGVALDPSPSSMHWNPAHLAFMPNPAGMSISYSPWLQGLGIDNSDLSYLSGYSRIDEFSGFGGSIRYFSAGAPLFIEDLSGQNILDGASLKDFAFDAGYARKLSKRFSVGVALRFIYSHLLGYPAFQGINWGEPTHAAIAYAIAGDFALYYRNSDLVFGNISAQFSFGLNMSNVGTKVSYSPMNAADFIPSNLKVGAFLNIDVGAHNAIGIAVDLNKLMIPTLPVVEPYFPSSGGIVLSGYSPNVSVPKGMIQSFYDAPGNYDSTNGEWHVSPFLEEIREINPSIGLQWWYKKTIALRAGYFFEHPSKGYRQYATLGMGFQYKALALDLSYLIPAYISTNQRTGTSPLANTVRLTLSFNFNGDSKDQEILAD